MNTKIMMRNLIASILFILAGVSVAFAQDFAYVANSGTDNVSVIDLSTNTITTTVAVGDVPVDIAVAPNGATLAVVNATDNSISVIDVATNTVTNTINVSGIPSDATFNAAGDRIYVSFLAGNRVDVFDLAGSLQTSVPFSGGPTDIAFRPGTSDLYVLQGSNGTAGIIDGSTNTATATSILLEGLNSGTPTLPIALAFTPSGNKAYVANNADFEGSVIDAANGNAVSVIAGQFGGNAFINGAIATAVSPDGTKAYVVAEGGNQLLIIDTSTDAVIATAFIPFGTNPNSVVISNDNATAYVTGGSTNQVLLYDATTAAAGSPASIALPTGAVPRDIVIAGVVDPCAGFPLAFVTQFETINQGGSFNFNGTNLTVAGTYVDTLLSVDGCDSVEVTLTLNVVDPSVASNVQTALNNAISLTGGGVSAAVLQPDGSIVTAGNGFASLGGAVADDIFFGTSDVSQHVLAILIQKLIENSQISLTTGLGPAASTLTLGGPYTGQNVEAALRHTSGAPDLTTGAAPFNDPASLIFAVLNTNWAAQNYAPIAQTFAGSQAPATPGTFTYSRFGFMILGELLEISLGQNLQPLLDVNGLTAAALGELQYFGTGNGNAGPFDVPSPASAFFFNLSGTGAVALSDQTSPISASGASGSLFATPRGMAGLMKAVYQDQTLLNASSLSNLQNFNAVSGRLGNAYGQGTERFSLNIGGTNVDFIGHTGDINYKSAFIYAPSLNTGAYVTTNNNDVSDTTVLEIARQLINAAQDPCAGFPSTNQTIDTTICANESFDFNGTSYTSAGTFLDTLLSSAGCDSVFVTINLNVNPTFTSSFSASIQQGDVFQFGTQILTTSGTFTEVFTAANGCDSTVTLNLTVVSPNPGTTAAIQNALDANLPFLGAGGYTAAVLNADGSISTVANGFARLGDAFDAADKVAVGDVSNIILAALGYNAQDAAAISLASAIGTVGGTAINDAQSVINHLGQISGANDFNNAGYRDVSTSFVFADLTFDFGPSDYAASFTQAGAAGAAGSFNYASTNALAVGEFLEGATSQTLQQLVDTYVNNVVGTSNGFEFYNTSTANVAQALRNLSGNAATFLSSNNSIITASGAAGGFVATPFEVAKFMKALFQDQNLVSAINLTSMNTTTFASATTGRLPQSTNFGVGTEFFDLDIDGTTYQFVGAVGNVSYPVAFIYGPSIQTGAFVATNNGEINDSTMLEIARQLIRVSLDPNACPAFATPVNIGATICANETFDFNGTILSAAGTFTDTLTDANGCDSVVVLTLAVTPLPTVNNVSITLCDNETTGVDLTANEPSINTNVGTFEYVGITNPANATVSDGQVINVVYTEGGSGCSDTAQISVTVLPTASTTLNVTIQNGDSFDFDGNTLTTPGTFTATFAAANGCDSIVTLNLTVVSPADSLVDALQAALDANLLPSGGLSASILNADNSIATVSNGFAGIGSPVAAADKFGLSEFSQTVMAVLTLAMDEAGVISLADALGAVGTNVNAAATVAQALAHTSGNTDFRGAGYDDPSSGIVFADLTFDFAAGNYAPIFALTSAANAAGTFDYANTNFLALGEFLETATGQTLQQLVDTYIQTPGGISGLEFFTNSTTGLAQLFVNLSGNGATALSNNTSYMTAPGAAGGFVATPTDVARFMKALFVDQTILNASDLAALQTFSAITGRQSTAYGLGIEEFVLNIDGTNYNFVGHTGDINFSAAFIYSSTINTGAYVSTNNADVSQAEILEIARQLVRVSLDPDACPAFATPVNISATICANETFDFNGTILTVAGQYTDTLITAEGCDSVIVLDLAVAPLPAVNNVSIEVCDNETTGVDLTVNQSAINSNVGSFEYVGIVDPTNATVSNGQVIEVVYTEGGTGCSDTAQITVTVNPTFNVVDNQAINLGDTLIFGTDTLTVGGTFVQTFTSANGCDSTVTLNLTVVGETSLFLSPDTSEIGLNQQFTLDLFLEAGPQLVDGFFADITFDPTKVNVVSISEQATAEFPTPLIAPTFNNALGTIQYSRGTFANFPSGTILLASITFQAVGATTPTTDVDFVGLTDLTFGGISVLSSTAGANVLVRDLASLTINYSLQGRTDFSGAENGNFFTVELYEPGTTNLEFSFPGLVGTAGGQVTVNNVFADEYDIWIKHTKYLANLGNSTLVGGPNSVNAGELRAGDANNDNLVLLTDFSILSSTFGLIPTDPGYNEDADFNGDGPVVLIDFSLLVSNFNTAGAVPGGTPSFRVANLGSTNGSANLVWSYDQETVRPGDLVTATLYAETDEQLIDGVEAHLNFNPEKMEIIWVEMGTDLDITLAKSFDNEAGNLNLAAGTLSNFVSGSIKVATVTFRAKANGEADMAFVNRGHLKQDVTFAGKSVFGETEVEALVIGTTSINNQFGGLEVEVYPIPSDGKITLEINGVEANKELDIQIINMAGQVVLEKSVKGSIKENLDLTGNAKGVYRIHVIDEDKSLVKNFMIK